MTTSTIAPVVSEEMIARYREDGYLKLSRVFDDAELEQLEDVVRRSEGETHDGLTGQAEGADTGAYAYQTHERYRQMWSNAFDLRLRFPVVMQAVSRLAVVARALLGEDVRVFWDKTIVKPPAHVGTRQSVWHQDFPYNPIDRRGMLTVWVAIEDVPAASGAMRFVPRSHRIGPLGRLDLVAEDHRLEDLLRPDDLERVGDPVTIPLAAGEATVHDALTLHGAGPNETEHPRRGWTAVFIPASTLYTGGPHPQADIDSLGLKPNQRFDAPRFLVREPREGEP